MEQQHDTLEPNHLQLDDAPFHLAKSEDRSARGKVEEYLENKLLELQLKDYPFDL